MRQIIPYIRFWGGYTLFVFIIVYAITKMPVEVMTLRWQWLIPVLIALLIMFSIQVKQVTLFLDCHGIKHDWLWPALFTSKKGILNTVMPAKTGSLVLIQMLTKHYNVIWYQYVSYSIFSAITALVISALAIVWLIEGLTIMILATLIFITLNYLVSKNYASIYQAKSTQIFLMASLMYFTMLAIFWMLLNGLGLDSTLTQASQFAVASNTLAQVSITPGNIGVREFVLGLISPYISIPPSIGVLAGGIFFVFRTIVYAVIMACLDNLFFQNENKSGRKPS